MFIFLLFRHFWIVLILMSCLNSYGLRIESKKYIAHDPSLRPGYEKLIKATLIYFNIPWIIMGIGTLSSFTNNPTDYFNIDSGNSFVVVFYLYFIILWTTGIRWIFFKDGAAFLEKHPGMFRGERFGSSATPARQIKIFFGALTVVVFIRLVVFCLSYFSL